MLPPLPLTTSASLHAFPLPLTGFELPHAPYPPSHYISPHLSLNPRSIPLPNLPFTLLDPPLSVLPPDLLPMPLLSRQLLLTKMLLSPKILQRCHIATKEPSPQPYFSWWNWKNGVLCCLLRKEGWNI